MGWIQCEKVKWLQNNNPEVLGLVYKLTPTEEKVRKLKKVRDLWQDIMEVQEIRDVFTGQPVKKKKYDIDHFIPWLFVMNDELWNLMSMDAITKFIKEVIDYQNGIRFFKILHKINI